MQVVDHGDESVIRLGQPVLAGFAVDEGVGGVAGALEGDDAFALVNPKVGECAVNRMGVPQMLDDFELGNLAIGLAGILGRRGPWRRAATLG